MQCLARMNRGGAETFVMNVLRNLDREKYEVWFLLSSDKGDYTEEIKSLGGKIFSIGTRRDGIKFLKEINRFFKKNKGKIDTLHLHTSSLSSLEILWFAKFYGVKKRIIHCHSTKQFIFIHKILHYLQKPFLRFAASYYFACSEKAADWLFSNTGIKSKAKVINNGINLDDFKFSEEKRIKKREELGIHSDTKVLIHVGRFCEVKNHIFLINLFANFHSKYPDSKLIMVGEGELKQKIQERAKSLGVEKDVIFAGLQNDVSPWLQAADVFVMPSLYEGLPVALVEAQTSGLSIVTSKNVPKEAQINQNYNFVGLDEPIENWIDSIMKYIDVRNENLTNVKERGYDIKNTVEELEKNVYSI